MLDIVAGRVGSSRRSFLRVGALGLAGLSLPELLRLRAEAAAGGKTSKDTAVIQVILGGGPSHVDTYDPKPNAPREFRGEFGAIATKVPGVFLSELMPGQARVMDKVAVVRSLHHTTSDHGVGMHWIMTGFASSPQNLRGNERPSVGSIVARLRGSNARGIPPYLGIPDAPSNGEGAYLGPGFNPFPLGGDPTENVRLTNLEPTEGLSLERLDDRRYLLDRLDRLDRARDAAAAMAGMDKFTAEAYEMVAGPRARLAFDLAREDPKVRDRYGRTQIGQSLLLARRLVEAGATFVTIGDDGWDHHAQVFNNCRRQVPPLDTAIASLVEDLHDRGLAGRVLLLVWGEFGRTPRINGGNGRDHWPGAMSALLAGGGLTMGQTIGTTNARAEAPAERALRPEDVLRTVYEVLGIDAHHKFLNEAGRPMAVLDQGRPIAELF